MKPLVALFAILVPLLLAGCAGDPAPTDPAATSLTGSGPLGVSDDPSTPSEVTYMYTGFARNGTPVVRGFLHIARLDSGRVAGHWQLRALVDTLRIGPQFGRGRLAGSYRAGAVHINLNPGNIDNNVFLSGRMDRAGLTGRWEWVGFPGVINQGTFVAMHRMTAAE